MPGTNRILSSAYLCASALSLFLFSLPATAQIQIAWVNRYSLDPSRTNQAVAMGMAPDGGIVVAGSSASTNGDLDYVVLKYASGGQQVWVTRYDSPTNAQDQLRGMALDTSGNVLITGTTKTVKLSGSGSVVWTAPYGGRAVATDRSNNV